MVGMGSFVGILPLGQRWMQLQRWVCSDDVALSKIDVDTSCCIYDTMVILCHITCCLPVWLFVAISQ